VSLWHCPPPCDVEWVSVTQSDCWLCGNPGVFGDSPNSDGRPFIWNGVVQRPPEEEEAA